MPISTRYPPRVADRMLLSSPFLTLTKHGCPLHLGDPPHKTMIQSTCLPPLVFMSLPAG